MSAVKRKRHMFLTLQGKNEILQKLKSGVSGTFLAEEYGVTKSTICKIKSKETAITTFLSNAEFPGKRKTLRESEFPKTEKALFTWFKSQRDRNVPISTALLIEKAKHFHSKFKEGNGFEASVGWVEKFKRRHGIRILKITGEKLSSRPELVDPFQNKLREEIVKMSLSLDQVYNADESALFWKCLPDKTLVHQKEKSAPGRKSSKERVTFLVCANATGKHKLRLMVVGKSMNPRSFKGHVLPVDYCSSKTAWMTTFLFKNWFFKHFVPQVKKFLRENNLPEKALLLIDNAPSHPSEDQLVSDDGNIKAMFIPPSCTAIIQPMDQSAISVTKLNYKKMLLSNLIESGSESFEKSLKETNLYQAVKYLARYWDSVPTLLLQNCWNKILPSESDDPEDNMPLALLRQQIIECSSSALRPLLETIAPDANFCEGDITDWVSEIEIIAEESERNEFNVNSERSSSDEADQISVRHELAVKSFDICIDWASENNISCNDMSTLRRIRDTAFKLKMDRVRQTKISHFFTKN